MYYGRPIIYIFCGAKSPEAFSDLYGFKEDLDMKAQLLKSLEFFKMIPIES